MAGATAAARFVEGTRLLLSASLAVAAFGLTVVVWYAVQVVVLERAANAGVTGSVGQSAARIQPDTPLRVTVRGTGVQLEGARLFRTEDGTRASEEEVPVRLQPSDQDGVWQVIPATRDPLLRPDGAYRLSVRVAASRPALPMPRTDVVDKNFSFATVSSPHPSLPTHVMQPRWAAPISITWSQPMAEVQASAQPNAPVRVWIDRGDATRTWIQLGDQLGLGLEDGQTYEVRVANARALDGITLQRPVAFQVAVPRRPLFVDAPITPVTLRNGEAFTLRSTLVLAEANVSLSPGSPGRVTAGRDHIRVDVPDYQQGLEFDLDVLSATSFQGAPLERPLRIRFETPPALADPALTPDDGALGVHPSAHPAITFAEPILDQAAATRALRLEPAVAGHWEWTSPTRVEFVPETALPFLTDMTIGVLGGPRGPRSIAGGYLENDLVSAFRTTDFKRLDVNLSRQTMTLFEYDEPIRTFAVATGVAGAPTPIGTFTVQMKAPQLRFKGVNPDGTRYDIPDVHWVLPFWGDFTIHGAYWRPRFGVPGSAGCVSLSDPDAKAVFDWANVGTRVVIHH